MQDLAPEVLRSVNRAGSAWRMALLLALLSVSVLLEVAPAYGAVRGFELVSPEGSKPYSVGGANVTIRWPVAKPDGSGVYWVAAQGGSDEAPDDGGRPDIFLAERASAPSWASTWLTDYPDPAVGKPDFEQHSMTGRAVTFTTQVNILPEDTNGTAAAGNQDLYRATEGGQELLSASSSGSTGANGVSISISPHSTPDLSATAFVTSDPLLPEDGDAAHDVYLRDGGGLTLISKNRDGTPNNGGAAEFLLASPPGAGWFPANHGYTQISAAGGVVAFQSNASHDPLDTDTRRDIYVWHNGEVALASDNVMGAADCSTSSCAATFVGMAADGSVVYFSTSEKLTAPDVDTVADIYGYRPTAGTLELATGGTEATGAFPATVSASGALFFSSNEALTGTPLTGTNGALYRWDGSAIQLVAERGATDPGVSEFHDDNPTSNQHAWRRPVRASLDGSRLVFPTKAQLDAPDTDDALDLYLWEAGEGVKLVSGGGSADARMGGAGINPFIGYIGGRILAEGDPARVFFNSPDALTADAPADGTPKLYEWEEGVGVSLVAATPDGVQ